jgi:hypothetical protein
MTETTTTGLASDGAPARPAGSVVLARPPPPAPFASVAIPSDAAARARIITSSAILLPAFF